MRYPNMADLRHFTGLLPSLLVMFACALLPSVSLAANGKILATPGVFQVEGSAGGGLVPWAQLAGYAADSEVALNGFCSRAHVDDYRLDTCGAQVNLYDRLELSVAQQSFTVDALDAEIRQNIVGIKTRIYGDVIYSRWPQLSVGMQHKTLIDPAIAFLLGAEDGDGQDFYLAASKLHLGALMGYNFFWNITLRSTEANQLGILGFGGTRGDRSLQTEISSAVFLSPNWALGVEYRQKPDNLSIREDNWRDLFIAWFPNKGVSVTAAWLDLGEIAGQADQRGWYFSVGGYW